MNHYRKKIRTSVAAAIFLLILALFCTLIAKNNPFDDDEDTLSPGVRNQDEAFDTYIEDLFRQEAAAGLLTLHYTLEQPEKFGIENYNVSLGQYSADNALNAASYAENVRHMLSSFQPDALSSENRLTLDVLTDTLKQTEEAAGFSYYEEPLRPSTGIQSELPILLAEYTFGDARDVTDYLQLLESLPAYFSQIAQYEREKSAAGLFMSDFAADTIISQCSDFAASGEDNYLIYTFEQKLKGVKGLSANQKRDYQKQNQALILNKVLPAFQSAADVLTSLKGTGKNNAGLCAYDDGKAYYEYLVRASTGSSDSVKKLQERTENQRVSDLTEASVLLAQNSSLEKEIQKADTPEDTPEKMLALLKKAITKDFPDVPDCKSTVKYVDKAMEDYLAPAFYLTSPLDNLNDNSIYINRKNSYEGIRLFTTLAHEGFPGHLYQNVVFHSSSPDHIRTLLGYPGYAEGWATYVEMHSYQYADLSENAARLLALDQSAILSLYATADMGIHSDGWSYSDTFAFFSKYGITDKAVVRSIFELIVEEPAHYLKYYIGYLEFLSLKDYAKETFGDNYSDKAFHQAVLEIGPAPFSILKKYLPCYYKQGR